MRRMPGVTISSSSTTVSEFLYSLIQVATYIGGTPICIVFDNLMVRDMIKRCCHIAIHQGHWDLPFNSLFHRSLEHPHHFMSLATWDAIIIIITQRPPAKLCIPRQFLSSLIFF